MPASPVPGRPGTVPGEPLTTAVDWRPRGIGLLPLIVCLLVTFDAGNRIVSGTEHGFWLIADCICVAGVLIAGAWWAWIAHHDRHIELRFDSDGIHRVGQRRGWTVPWDAITALTLQQQRNWTQLTIVPSSTNHPSRTLTAVLPNSLRLAVETYCREHGVIPAPSLPPGR